MREEIVWVAFLHFTSSPVFPRQCIWVLRKIIYLNTTVCYTWSIVFWSVSPKALHHKIRRDSDYFNTTGTEQYKECVFKIRLPIPRGIYLNGESLCLLLSVHMSLVYHYSYWSRWQHPFTKRHYFSASSPVPVMSMARRTMYAIFCHCSHSPLFCSFSPAVALLTFNTDRSKFGFSFTFFFPYKIVILQRTTWSPRQ